ncbi:MAG: hypothetical protein H0W76_13330 [Pyrinomonadaceae bacterium]|nr:hypothetical protein [Pyrinomonadaceae bacterium]
MFQRSTKVTLAVSFALLMATSVSAQRGAGVSLRSGRRARAVAVGKAHRATTQTRTATIAPSSLLSGVMVVKVTPDFSSIIHLGLAQGGVTVVEFPSTDSIHRVHNANDDLVTPDYTNKNVNEPLIIRPGKSFVANRFGDSQENKLTVQMGSGVFLTFLIHPVMTISQNADRVMIRYDRAEMVAARRNVGLPVDYKPVPEAPGVPGRAVERREEVAQASSASTPAAAGLARPASFVTAGASSSAVTARTSASTSQAEAVEPPTTPTPEVVQAVRDALRQATKSKKKSFGRFTPSRHGLSLAVTPARDINGSTRFILVAVRNTLKELVRLVSGQPELLVETVDENKRPVQAERVRKVYSETTAPNGNMILPGATVYYAVAFEPLVLGVQQHFRVSVAQDTAADAPAFLDLTVLTR